MTLLSEPVPSSMSSSRENSVGEYRLVIRSFKSFGDSNNDDAGSVVPAYDDFLPELNTILTPVRSVQSPDSFKKI